MNCLECATEITHLLFHEHLLDDREVLPHMQRKKEIAKVLAISDETVKHHIMSIFKGPINDCTAAIVKAMRHGWIKIEATVR